MSLSKRECLRRAAEAQAAWEAELPKAAQLSALGIPSATALLDLHRDEQKFWTRLARVRISERRAELRRRVAEDKRKTATDGA